MELRWQNFLALASRWRCFFFDARVLIRQALKLAWQFSRFEIRTGPDTFDDDIERLEAALEAEASHESMMDFFDPDLQIPQPDPPPIQVFQRFRESADAQG